MTRKEFEQKLGNIFLNDRNDFYKDYYEQISIINRILEDIKLVYDRNIYDDFKEEVLKILMKSSLREKELRLLLTKVNEKLRIHTYGYKNYYKLSLYEEEIRRYISPKYSSPEEEIILNGLKILYLLDKRFSEVKIFERKYKNQITYSLDYKLNLREIIKIILNKNYELLDKIKYISSKEQMRLYILLIENLIIFESIEKKIPLKKLEKKYLYKDLIYIEEYLQEFKIFKNKIRGTVIIKNILEQVFNRKSINKFSIELIKEEVVEIFITEKKLKKLSIIYKKWYNGFIYNKFIVKLFDGSEEVLNRYKLNRQGILALNYLTTISKNYDRKYK